MAKVKTTSQLHAELKDLAKKVRANIYDMLHVANAILQDAEYVDRFGGESKLIEIMEGDEFVHFGGNPSLAAMLRAYRANPGRSTWEKYKFNIRAMIDLSLPVADGAETERIHWKALAKKLQERVAELESMLQNAQDLVQSQRTQLDTQNREIGELRGELRAVKEFAA